ncbi:hypothetical protein [Chitinimonas lacunae]|uniref:Uncharacterized protein n=1 Tax=Chitinimonas lacunae TaxID=1963018 RepID=A0ABV8MPL9_9NEIS
MIIDRLSLTAHREQAQPLMQALVQQPTPARSRAEQTADSSPDPVRLSPAVAESDQSWRHIAPDYPTGFPTEVREALGQIAADPRVSYQDYALLQFKVLELPQAEAGLLTAGSLEAWRAQGSPRDDSVFANGFDLPAHLRRLLQEARTAGDPGNQSALLQRLI